MPLCPTSREVVGISARTGLHAAPHRTAYSLARMHYSTVRRPYKFHVAADWAGKPPHRGLPPPKFSLPAHSPIVSWRDKSLSRLSLRSGSPLTAGEDFFLCTDMQHNSGVSLGVADGVGGWIEKGIDSSMFSQALMYYAHAHLKNAWAGEPEIDPTVEAVDAAPGGVEMAPSECLRLAYNDVLADQSVPEGSSTGCLLTLNSATGILRSANLGDSGFCVIRSSSMFYHSFPQTHYFNCPFQLCKEDLKGVRGRNVKKTDSIRDPPTLAQERDISLRDGDIVIVYTDGLTDNVFPAEILAICSLSMGGQESETEQVQTIATHLVSYARKCMFSDKVSPFQLDARRHKKYYMGGKVDDVTVVVALVRETI